MARDIVLAVEVDAEAGAIYRAVTTEDGLTSFWTPTVSATAELGAELRFGFAAAPVDLRMVVTTLEPDRAVGWSCGGPWPGWEGTQVRWEMQPAEAGGRLVLLRHTGWADETADVVIGSVALTWARVLVALEQYLRTGVKAPALD